MRTLLKRKSYTFTTGVYSPIQARIAEHVGLDWIFVSGYSCSLGYLARPDLGFASMAEMVAWSRLIAKACGLPVIVDGDDGFGDVLQVMRTVEEFEQAGVSGLTIEDQRLPKRCGHLPGRRCLPVEDAVRKLRAGLEARSDPDFLIIARTDAYGAEGGGGIESVIERGLCYADAGVDAVWAEFPDASRDDAQIFAHAIKARFPDLPLFFNYSSSFRWTQHDNPMTFAELGAMGYRMIVLGLGAIHAAMHGEWNFMMDLKTSEEKAQWQLETLLKGHPTEDHHAMGEWQKYQAIAARFTAASDQANLPY